MSIPNIKAEREEFDYELHIKAGLIPWEKNEDGEQEWIGTREKWSLYEDLREGAQEDIQFYG